MDVRVIVTLDIPQLTALGERFMETVETLTQSIVDIQVSVTEGFSALATHLDTETQQVLAAIEAAKGQGVDLTPVATAVEGLRSRLAAGFQAAQNAIDQVIP